MSSVIGSSQPTSWRRNSWRIKTSIKTDHSAITLSISGLDETERGSNFWKFNSNLVNDSDYCEILTTEYVNWLEEFKEVQDKHVLWNLIKYKIRQRKIKYIKGKVRERRAKLQKVEAWTTRLNNSYGKPSGHATDISFEEFCMEMLDGGKWRRQHYFNFIFGSSTAFSLIELLIFALKRERRISRL